MWVLLGVQQTEGSSTAAAPSVMALTHLAIVWEALLIESEHKERNGNILPEKTTNSKF